MPLYGALRPRVPPPIVPEAGGRAMSDHKQATRAAGTLCLPHTASAGRSAHLGVGASPPAACCVWAEPPPAAPSPWPEGLGSGEAATVASPVAPDSLPSPCAVGGEVGSGGRVPVGSAAPPPWEAACPLAPPLPSPPPPPVPGTAAGRAKDARGVWCTTGGAIWGWLDATWGTRRSSMRKAALLTPRNWPWTRQLFTCGVEDGEGCVSGGGGKQEKW